MHSKKYVSNRRNLTYIKDEKSKGCTVVETSGQEQTKSLSVQLPFVSVHMVFQLEEKHATKR